MAERPRIIFSLDKQYSTDPKPRQFSSKDLLDTLDSQHKWMVSANEKLTLAKPTVDKVINVDGPFKLVLVGDTHLFSTYSSEEAVKRTLKMLDEENAFGIVTGDFIEGMNPHIPDHPGSIELDFGKQIVAASKILLPYFYSGKLLAMSEGYFGHEGWLKKNGGASAVELMARLMPKMDSKNPMDTDKWTYPSVLLQGGLLKLKLKNGRDYIIKVFHDPGSGGSDSVNRQGSLKSQFLNEDDDLFLEDGVHADMYIAGHLHHRGVVSKEVFFDRMARKEKSVVFVQIGASKGIELNSLDPFLTAQGKGPSIGPGPAIIVHQTRGNANGSAEVTKEWVDYGYDKAREMYDVAQTLHKAEDRLNTVARQNLTNELLEKIIDRSKKPVTTFNIRNSGRSPKEKPGRAPLFDDMSWQISNVKDFPVLVYLLQNARYGSSSHDGSPYKGVYSEILKEAAENPFKYVLVMRHFIDKGVASNIDRRAILNSMANDLGAVSSANRLLGIMLSSTLLDHAWQKDVVQYKQYYDRIDRKWKSNKNVDPGFQPGDELYYKSAVKKTADKDTPLYVNESLLRLQVGKADYSFFLLDKLGRSGSEFNMVQGLVQTRKKEHVTADVTTGGHMPLAGFSVYPPRPRIYMAPGSFSNWDAGGKGNDKRVAVGGQAVVLFSDKKFIIPTSNVSEAGDIFNALMLDKGLTDDEKRKLAKRTK